MNLTVKMLAFGLVFKACFSVGQGGDLSKELAHAPPPIGVARDDEAVVRTLLEEMKNAKTVNDRQAALEKLNKVRFKDEIILEIQKIMSKPLPSKNLQLENLETKLHGKTGQERQSCLVSALRECLFSIDQTYMDIHEIGRKSVFVKDVLDLLVKEGITDDVRNELNELAFKGSIPLGLRPQLLRVVYEADMEKEGLRASAAKVGFILEKIQPPPHRIIPWDIYNDVQKRVDYVQSKKYREQAKGGVQWRLSDESVREEAIELVLNSHRIDGVKQIVALLRKNRAPPRRLDYLALIAARLLAGMPTQENAGLSVAELNVLERYVDSMRDEGAFCNRNRTIMYLNRYYANMKTTNFPSFKEGGNVLATILGHGQGSGQAEVGAKENQKRLFVSRWQSLGGVLCAILLLFLLLFLRLKRKRFNFDSLSSL